MTACADADKPRIVVCPKCRHDRFCIWTDRRAGWRDIACVGCGAVLMRVEADG